MILRRVVEVDGDLANGTQHQPHFTLGGTAMRTVFVLTLGHVVLGAYSTRDKAEQESRKFSPNLSTPVKIDLVRVDRPA